MANLDWMGKTVFIVNPQFYYKIRFYLKITFLKIRFSFWNVNFRFTSFLGLYFWNVDKEVFNGVISQRDLSPLSENLELSDVVYGNYVLHLWSLNFFTIFMFIFQTLSISPDYKKYYIVWYIVTKFYTVNFFS